jgi:hypothetical protein
MQARELTAQEVADGSRGISERQLTATEVQALVRAMDASKTRWAHLRRQGKQADYEANVKKENEMLYFNYPSLFDMHIHDKVDSTLFEMLALKRKIERGEITAEEASRVVGQSLFQRFVPQAAAPSAPRLSYEEYYAQSQNGRSE